MGIWERLASLQVEKAKAAIESAAAELRAPGDRLWDRWLALGNWVVPMLYAADNVAASAQKVKEATSEAARQDAMDELTSNLEEMAVTWMSKADDLAELKEKLAKEE